MPVAKTGNANGHRCLHQQCLFVTGGFAKARDDVLCHLAHAGCVLVVARGQPTTLEHSALVAPTRVACSAVSGVHARGAR